nr:hypothetical protein [Candidatus Cloacimonadota bacterium]
MLKRIILILPLLLSLLYSISYFEADGRTLDLGNREFHYHNHNSSNDYNFFGSNRWAVRFDFKRDYPGMENLLFSTHGARLWFPNMGDSVTVELALDSVGGPGIPVARKRAAVDQQMIDISFDTEIEADVIWLLVDYRTNMSNRFVAASRGSGTNSYYMNQLGELQYLSSFSNSGFNCDLLFGLLGDFVFDEADLRLQSFDLEGDLVPGGVVYPSFSIYNHSPFPINEAELTLVFSRPGFAEYNTLNIAIPHSLEAHELYEFDSQSGFLPTLSLPIDPTQLRIEATVHSEYPESDLHIANNSKLKHFEIFIEESPFHLVENFIREDQSSLFNQIQQSGDTSRLQFLNYYPILSDSLANLGSMRRFNWYSYNSIPITTGAGHQQIFGFTNNYEDLFYDLLLKISQDRSFISSSSYTIRSQENSDNINIDLQFTNDFTSLYTSTTQSLMMQSRIFVGLFKKHDFGSSQSYVFSNWIAFADTVNSALNLGATINKSYQLQASGISFDDLVQDYRIYYWIQQKNGGRIYYADFCEINPETNTSVSDDLVPAAVLELYPNPLFTNKELSIHYPDQAQLSIFNIRGQRIYYNPNFSQSEHIKNSVFPASGIYFVRIQSRGRNPISKKISIIK